MSHFRQTIMSQRTFLCAAIFFAALLLNGCPAPQETVKTEQPPAPTPPAEKKPAGPDLTLVVASINLGAVNRRIEKADIDDLCRTIAREKVDILAVEGMTRYPGVATRIDVYQEIAAGTGMRSIFGETNTVSGRQGGNALYSTYPISSHENTPYTGIASTNFESALLGLVDAGAREVAVVSTLVPATASAQEQRVWDAMLGSLRKSYGGKPMIVTGNLPLLPVPNGDGVFRSVDSDGPPPRTWYTIEGLRPLQSKVVESALGRILFTPFGVYREGRP